MQILILLFVYLNSNLLNLIRCLVLRSAPDFALLKSPISRETMNMPPHSQVIQKKNKKLVLAIAIHHNWYLSAIFAFLTGHIVFHKTSFFFCNSFQASLLVPTYFVWLIAELPRLYIGRKGVLCDKVRFTAAIECQIISTYSVVFSCRSWQSFYFSRSVLKFG